MSDLIRIQRRKQIADKNSYPQLATDTSDLRMGTATASSHDISRICLRPQARLTVSQPGDFYEQEADRVAHQVMTMGDQANNNAIQREASPHDEENLQLKYDGNTITPLLQREEIPKEEEEEELIQAKSSLQRFDDGGLAAGSDISSKLDSRRGEGSPLADDVRNFMEPRFGVDFSSVKVHTDGEAVQMSRELGAQAFTYGSDVYFGAGKVPGNDELTAHELTHVVQQTDSVQTKPLQNVLSTGELRIQRQDLSSTISASSPTSTSTQHPLEVQYSGNYGQALNAAVDVYDLIRDQIHQGCEDWYRDARETDPPSPARDILMAGVTITVSAVTGGLGGAIVGAAGVAAARISLNLAVEAGKTSAQTLIMGGVNLAMSNSSNNHGQPDALVAHLRGTQTSLAGINAAEKRAARVNLIALENDPNRWVVVQGVLDALSSVHQSMQAGIISRNACLDGWFAAQAQRLYGSETINGQTTTDEDQMASQIGMGSLEGTRGVLQLHLNNMLSPTEDQYAMVARLGESPGNNARIRSILSSRSLTDIHIPKVIVGDSMYLPGGGRGYFRIFYDENNTFTSIHATGDYSFWSDFAGNGGWSAASDRGSDDVNETTGRVEHSGAAQNAGRVWLALHGMYGFGEGGNSITQLTPEMFDTRVLWGIARVGRLLGHSISSTSGGLG